ncbi:unnamed protein product [Owenia fusiformis]|uniref:Nudix hydrolase domain-containing protein n=1 Tax=Owenia fusiformis TaxID=6347 RepID=A0A8S4NGK4_OWEFU|nr:unnamed protein product [Owenia fusiformis]
MAGSPSSKHHVVPSIKEIRERIIGLESPFSQLDMGLFSGAPKAAVLLPLILKDDDIYIMLTQRSDRMTHHKSTVALPGGMEDPEDKDSIDTALREAEEEIGLPRHLVTVLGSITPITAHPGTLVTPIVGIIPEDFIPVPNEQEVAHVFTIPLSRFLTTDNHRVKETTYHKIPIYIHYFDDEVNSLTFTTWGATAWICIQAAMVLTVIVLLLIRAFRLATGTECDVKLDTSSCDLTVRGGGLIGEYDVNVIVFHTYGSEHTINGKHFPIEMHLGNRIKWGNPLCAIISYVSVMFEISPGDNKKWTRFIKSIDYPASIDQLRIQQLLPRNMNSFYRYFGSPTCPSTAPDGSVLKPTDEVAIWTIFKDTISISERQLRDFRSIMGYDPHYTATPKDMLPLQDINGRSTYEACDQDKFCNLGNDNKDTNLDNASKMCDYFIKGRVFDKCGSAKLHLEENSGMTEIGQDLIMLQFPYNLTYEDNSNWKFLIDVLDQAKRDGSVVDLEMFSLRSLLPDNMHDFTSSFGNQNDSLYSESARWLVFATPIGISESQMDKISSVIK